MAADDKIGCLETEALKRKERLKALKRKQEEKEDVSEDTEKKSPLRPENVLPKPKFRSYKPQDEGLQQSILPEAEPGNVEMEVQDQLESAKSRVVMEELDLANLAPRKPDWDLKRDVTKKLERLERRTQKAIAELIRDRLKKGQEDLLTTVTDGAGANQIPDADD